MHLDCLNFCFHPRFLTSVSRIVQVLAWFRFTKPRFLTTVSRIVQVAAWIRSTKTRFLATVSRIVQVVAWIKSTKHLLTTISRIAHLDRPQLLIPPSILENLLTSVSRIVQVLAWRIVHLECLNFCFHPQFLTSASRIVQVLAWFRFTKT